jgi:cell division septal protein FtsQ
MPRKFEAKNIERVGAIRIGEEDGVVSSLDVEVEVNYGEVGLAHLVNLYPQLTQPQRKALQLIYDTVKAKVEEYFLR